MWRPASSARRSVAMVRVLWLLVGCALALGGAAREGPIPGSPRDAVAQERALRTSLAAAGFSADGAWEPPAEIAREIRSAVAARWGLIADSVHIEWADPGRPIHPDAKLGRLLGPGRVGSWIALLDQVESRMSLRFRAGVRVWSSVARIDLPRERRLTAGDMERAQVVAWGPPEDRPTEAAVGWLTRRPLASGEPLVPPAVIPPPTIRAGQAVTVRWTGGRVSIEVPAEAVGDAALGATVLVRLATGLRVRGVASDSQTVVMTESVSAGSSRHGATRRPE